MAAEKEIRIHQLRDLVAIDSPGMQQTVYLSAENAIMLGRELVRFGISGAMHKVGNKDSWLATRLVTDGRAVNECDGEEQPRNV